MAKRVLPEKTCAICKLPFTWRKKWRNNWEEVKYCSERCRKQRKHIVQYGLQTT
jgi:hypothetical protein